MQIPLVGATGALLLGLSAAAAAAQDGPKLLFSWTAMAWAFDDLEAQAAFEASGVAERAPLAGVEGDASGNVYVTTPRWLAAGVPSTLSRVEMIDGAPLLVPFPSRAAHDLANPDAIRNGLGIYVDSKQRMWIVDMGWVAGEETVPDGAQKLIGIDLATGAEIARFPIGDDLAPGRSRFSTTSSSTMWTRSSTSPIAVTGAARRCPRGS